MSNQIYDILRQFYRLERHDGQFGIEIETETKKAYIPPTMKFWAAHVDGSLRDFGQEYVLKAPLSLGEPLDLAFNEFKTKTEGIAFIPDSISTSVHVHVNMLNSTFLTLANFLTAYSLVENLLIRFSGPDRLSNLFCLPMCDAEGVNSRMVDLIRNVDAGSYQRLVTSMDRSKYSALNLAPFTTLGTVEVRSMRGTTDTDLIRTWVKMLGNLHTFASQNLTPVDILTQYRDAGPELVGQIFTDVSEHLNYADKMDLIAKNVWYASAIASISKDWSKFGIPKKTKITENKYKKKLDEYSFRTFDAPYASLTEIQQRHVVELVERDLMAANIAVPAAAAGGFRNVEINAVNRLAQANPFPAGEQPRQIDRAGFEEFEDE